MSVGVGVGEGSTRGTVNGKGEICRNIPLPSTETVLTLSVTDDIADECPKDSKDEES